MDRGGEEGGTGARFGLVPRPGAHMQARRRTWEVVWGAVGARECQRYLPLLPAASCSPPWPLFAGCSSLLRPRETERANRQVGWQTGWLAWLAGRMG